MRTLLVLLLSGLVSCTSLTGNRDTYTGKHGDSFNFRLVKLGEYGGLIEVPVTVNGVNGRWLLDSGAQRHVIDKRFTQKVGGIPSGTKKVAGAGGIHRVSVIALSQVCLSSRCASNTSAVEEDLRDIFKKDGEIVDGILGLPFFLENTVRINFASRNIETFDGVNGDFMEGTAIPVTQISGLPTVAFLFAGKYRENFLLDTGNAGGMIFFSSPDYMRRGHHKTELPSFVFRELAGETRVAFAAIEHVALGKFKWPWMGLAFIQNDEPRSGLDELFNIRGSVGNGVWGDRTITLDLPRNKLYVEGTATFHDQGGYGFTLAMVGAEIVIDKILEDSPAGKKGIKEGDRLLSVNGIILNTISEVWSEIHGKNKLKLLLSREGAEQEYDLIKERYLPVVL